MRLHRFIGDFDLDRESLRLTDTELLNQLKNVLRLKDGDRIVLCDGMGIESLATIIECEKKYIDVSIEDRMRPMREPTKETTLFCAVLKRENFELVLQKATELGITRIIPLLTERTVKTGFNRERLEKILREAAEQSGRTKLPTLGEPIPFTEALSFASPLETVFFDLSGKVQKHDVYRKMTACFIGPEGGFSDEEVLQAEHADFPVASLGELTLRGETAAVVACYLITS